ncbi:MAG: ROK family protein [Clostridia bacterium]|nr:ROK family protein [Clostridia bacterium]
MYILGFDIGGTKSAVVTASWDGDRVEVLKKDKCPTDRSIDPYAMIDRLISMADALLDRKPDAIGISCGGPLDSGKGVIMSPPNLPEWDGIEIVDYIEKHYGVKAHLQNDANACALAEWKFGAGKGSRNMVFMTFGTGLGAGLILNGELYEGTNGNAGEVGHIRLKPDGPVGFGKAGSFEGFCSGGGIAQIGKALGFEGDENGVINAKTIADAAYLGNEKALETYRVSGEMLGHGLSVLIDILNPEVIVIGSVFARSRDLLWHEAEKIIEKEALSVSSGCCRVVPAQLGESIGDFGAIATALV